MNVYEVSGTYCDDYYIFGIYKDWEKANKIKDELNDIAKHKENWDKKNNDAWARIIEKYSSYEPIKDRDGRFTDFPLDTEWDITEREVLE